MEQSSCRSGDDELPVDLHLPSFREIASLMSQVIFIDVSRRSKPCYIYVCIGSPISELSIESGNSDRNSSRVMESSLLSES